MRAETFFGGLGLLWEPFGDFASPSAFLVEIGLSSSYELIGMVIVVERGGASVRRFDTVSTFGWVSFKITGWGGLLWAVFLGYSTLMGSSYIYFGTLVAGGITIGIVFSYTILIGIGFSISSNLGTTILFPFS